MLPKSLKKRVKGMNKRLKRAFSSPASIPSAGLPDLPSHNSIGTAGADLEDTDTPEVEFTIPSGPTILLPAGSWSHAKAANGITTRDADAVVMPSRLTSQLSGAISISPRRDSNSSSNSLVGDSLAAAPAGPITSIVEADVEDSSSKEVVPPASPINVIAEADGDEQGSDEVEPPEDVEEQSEVVDLVETIDAPDVGGQVPASADDQPADSAVSLMEDDKVSSSNVQCQLRTSNVLLSQD